MSDWVLYSREGCHLCTEMLSAVKPLLDEAGRSLDILDVDSKPELIAFYSARVPVLEYKDQMVCQYFADIAAVKQQLVAKD